jgi:hypothetical protein
MWFLIAPRRLQSSCRPWEQDKEKIRRGTTKIIKRESQDTSFFLTIDILEAGCGSDGYQSSTPQDHVRIAMRKHYMVSLPGPRGKSIFSAGFRELTDTRLGKEESAAAGRSML